MSDQVRLRRASGALHRYALYNWTISHHTLNHFEKKWWMKITVLEYFNLSRLWASWSAVLATSISIVDALPPSGEITRESAHSPRVQGSLICTRTQTTQDKQRPSPTLTVSICLVNRCYWYTTMRRFTSHTRVWALSPLLVRLHPLSGNWPQLSQVRIT